MKCSECELEYLDTSAFCPRCRTKNEFYVEKPVETSTANIVPDKKVWQKFAKVGNTFGIINIVFAILGFIGSFIPITGIFGIFFCMLAVELGVPGIVFSALGKNSKGYIDKASSGLIFNIIAVASGLLGFIISLSVLSNYL